MKIFTGMFLLLGATAAIAQPCGTGTAIGSSSNMFTNIVNSTMPVVADKNLNTIAFIHRNNATAFGGSSGHLRYDVSTDGGTTWSSNLGVLNPLMSFQARYPQAVIYNPAGNTVPNNAFIGYLAPTINGALFQGYVNGVRQLNGTGNTENYGLPNTQTAVPHTMVKGAPGVFWSIDAINNGTQVTGFRVFKGTWNGTDIAWAVNSTITPTFNTAFSGIPQVGDYNIAFDPTGQIGWISVLTHLTPGPTPYAFYPSFWHTTDGGLTWTGPEQIDLGQFSCIANNMAPGNFPSTNFESDLEVDVNGEPHLFSAICNGNNAYAIFYGQWHHMLDITKTGGIWNVIDISNVNAGRGTWGVSPNATTMDMAPQLARSADGTKLFYGWADNSAYLLGAANQTPNLFVRGHDIATRKLTTTRDVTSCQVALNGQAFYPKFAQELLEPVSGQYKIAAVTGIFTSNDPALIANFRFIDNLIFSNSDFSVNIPSAAVAIDQGLNYILCNNAPAILSITGTYNQMLWSNGSTNDSISVTTPGTYYITARAGCAIGRDTITVTPLAYTTTGTTQICPGDSATLSVSGNGTGYTWNPGNSSGTSVTVSPALTSTYTLTVNGSGGCAENTTMTVNVDTALVHVVAAAAICAGDSVTITANGVSSYNWPALGSSSATVTVSPATTTTYIVNGLTANGCASADSVAVTVNPIPVVTLSPSSIALCPTDAPINCPAPNPGGGTFSGPGVSGGTFDPQLVGPGSSTITYTYTDPNTGCVGDTTATATVYPFPVIVASSSSSTICLGDSVNLSAAGGTSYNWQPTNDSTANVTVFPAVTGSYMVTGTDSNGCVASDTVQVTVNALPDIGITASDTVICAGEPVTLTGTGALNYVWNPGNFSIQTITVSPVTTSTYTVSGINGAGCTADTSVTITVNPLPAVTFTGNTTVCVDDGAFAISGGSPAGGTYFGIGVSGGTFTPGVAGVGNFSIGYTYTNSNGCSDTANVTYTVNACVGITEQAQLANLQLYPNPNSGSFHLSLAGALSQELNVTIFDLHGRMIFAQQFNADAQVFEKDIVLPDAAAGMYYVKLQSGNTTRTLKMAVR